MILDVNFRRQFCYLSYLASHSIKIFRGRIIVESSVNVRALLASAYEAVQWSVSVSFFFSRRPVNES